jgi:hypothetical protein
VFLVKKGASKGVKKPQRDSLERKKERNLYIIVRREC